MSFIFSLPFIVSFVLFPELAETCIPTQVLENPTTTTTTTTTVAPVYICRPGWTIFHRDSYNWCMQIYFGTGWIIYTNGLALCQTLNPKARPTGFQNKNEIATMTSIGHAENSVLYGLLVGAKRTEACEYSNITPTCTALTSFVWTDDYTTGTDGFVWAPGQPLYDRSISNFDGDFVWLDTRYGYLNDQWFDNQIQGIVCGMLADVPKSS